MSCEKYIKDKYKELITRGSHLSFGERTELGRQIREVMRKYCDGDLEIGMLTGACADALWEYEKAVDNADEFMWVPIGQQSPTKVAMDAKAKLRMCLFKLSSWLDHQQEKPAQLSEEEKLRSAFDKGELIQCSPEDLAEGKKVWHVRCGIGRVTSSAFYSGMWWATVMYGSCETPGIHGIDELYLTEPPKESTGNARELAAKLREGYQPGDKVRWIEDEKSAWVHGVRYGTIGTLVATEEGNTEDYLPGFWFVEVAGCVIRQRWHEEGFEYA